MSKEEKLIIDYIELLKREYVGLTKKEVELWNTDLEGMTKILDRKREIIKELSDLRHRQNFIPPC